MRKLLLIAASAAVFVGASMAQSPLTTTFANNNMGAAGGGIYFDLTVNVPIVITQIDTNCTGTGSVDVLTCPTTRVGNQTNAGAWTLVGNGTVTGAVAGAQTTLSGLPPIPLAPGTYGIAYRGVGVSHNYTNGNGANQTYSTAELTLNAGEASNVAFVAPLFTPRVVNTNIHYQVSGGGTVATRSSYGAGCYDCPDSTYESFGTAASFDLNGTTVRATAGASYAYGPGAPYVAPTAAATTLALTDDSEVTVPLPFAFPMPCGAAPLTQFQVCSNGFISTASNGVAYTPSVSAAMNFANTSWGCWHDYNPAAGGAVKTELEGGSGAFVVTWDGVADFGVAGSANFWQMAFYPNGDVEYRFSQMSAAGGTGFLVYYSPAGASPDPGNRDISGTLAAGWATCCTPVAALNLAASARPVTGTTIQLATSQIPAGTTISVVLVNFSALVPGLSLAGLGMPGCFQHIALGGAVTLGVSVGSAPWNQPFGIPAGPAYVGTAVFAQSAALVAGVNPFGAVSSNGLRLFVGDI
jgi:hypothetical protein